MRFNGLVYSINISFINFDMNFMIPSVSNYINTYYNC